VPFKPDPGITVAIPAHPARLGNGGMLTRALNSVAIQKLPPAAVSVAVDVEGEGAPATRQRALDAVRTPWTAFLDSDDTLRAGHLKALLECALETEADYVYSWYHIVDKLGRIWQGKDVLPHFGKEFDPDNPTQTTITVLVRTELAKAIGFRQPPEGATINGERYGEDFQFTVECVKAGAKIVHLPVRTWYWSHHGANTSGRPDQGDARR
jgi:hypothetical protein